MKLLAIEKVNAVLSDVRLNVLSGYDLARWVARDHLVAEDQICACDRYERLGIFVSAVQIID
jgi:hypothetical protein